MKRKDWIGIVESVYGLDQPSHDAWLVEVMRVTRPLLQPVDMLGGSIFHFERGVLRASVPRGADVSYLSRAQAIAVDAPEYMKRCYRGRPFATMSTHVGPARFRVWETYRREFGSIGEPDAIGLVARDGGPWGVCVVGGRRRMGAVSREEAVVGGRIAAHVHAALRMRFRLFGPPPLVTAASPVTLKLGTDAVLSPNGKVEHAEAAAKPFVESLKRAALAIDRARARMRREDPDGALDLWRALVEGEWSLVETFERDGRRFLVARRNPPGAPRRPLLTPRERRVVGLRARQHEMKLIAYELGVSQASVSRALQSAARKLGLHSFASFGVDDA